MNRTILVSLGAAALAGCAHAPHPQREVLVYTGRPDGIPEHLRAAHLAERQGLSVTPPVPTPQPGSRGEPPAPDALGDVWEENEENMWRGTWIRRGESRLFDAYWVHPSGERVLAVVEIVNRGREVEVIRRHPDGQGCNYRGTIAENWVDVQGWYSCSWHGHTSPWRAQIIRMRDVSPALLSRGGWRRIQ